MSTILFLVILSCLVAVLHWYVKNETESADGEAGFLAIRDDAQGGGDEPDSHHRAYREKSRAPRPGALGRTDAVAAYQNADRRDVIGRRIAGYRPRAGASARSRPTRPNIDGESE